MKKYQSLIILLILLAASMGIATKWSDYGDMGAATINDLDTFLVRDVSDTSLAATGTQKEYPWSVMKTDIGTATMTLTNKTLDVAGTGNVVTLTLQKDFTISDPADADDFLLFRAARAITITDIYCIVDPAGTGESISLNIQECDGTGDNCATVDAAITCDNDGAEDDGSLSNGTIDAGDWVMMVLGAPSGTVSALTFSIYYTEAL